MSLLLENFQDIVQTEEDVDKLKNTILDLAMRGKLVPQDPNDEPASVLLERIEEEKERLVKEKKIRKPKKMTAITSEEIPYDIPETWSWIKLGETINLISGKHLRKDAYSKSPLKFPYLTGPSDFDKPINKWTDDESQSMSETNDILISVKGSIGRIMKNDIGRIAIGRQLMSLRPMLVNTNYVYILIENYVELLKSKSVGIAIPGISREDIQNLFLPLPPLKEQNRIVKKVNELFNICDQLYEQIQQQNTSNATLNTTVFNRIQDANNPNQYHDLKFAVEHMDSLCETEEDVNLLKQSILSLAIQGKLVKQDPNDEPASVLLEQIEKEKEQLVKEKKIRKPKKMPEITDQEKSYKLPPGWKWVRFGDVSINRDSERIPLSVADRKNKKGSYDYYGASGIVDKIDDYIFEEPLLLIGEDGANLKNRSTPIAFIASGKYWVNNHAHVIDAINYVVLDYLRLYINSIDLTPYVTGTAQPKMNQMKLNTIPIALPPLSEQKRIVNKIDKLFRMCDQLMEQLQRKNNIQEKFEMTKFNKMKKTKKLYKLSYELSKEEG